jgi:hypothetical protein
MEQGDGWGEWLQVKVVAGEGNMSMATEGKG